MPIPKPKKGESSEAFHSRCMDSEVMKREYPDIKQRNAICYSQARRAGRKVPRKK